MNFDEYLVPYDWNVDWIEHEIDAMVSVCSEFMRSFIIMGYDFEGNAINPIFYAKSDMDSDALSQYMQKFFMTQMH